MTFPRILGLIVFCLIASWALRACEEANTAAPSQSAKRPNFLIIVADDMGYSDLGVFGSEIETPNLDMLARDGLMLTNFYVAGTCSPTRAMLLTGVDHHSAGFGNMTEHIAPNQRGQPGYEGYLNERVVTVSQRLKDAGYRTYVAGKWHLGKTALATPTARGFDKSFVLVPGGASHFDNTGLHQKVNPAPFLEDGQDVELPEAFRYSTDFYTDKMMDYLDADKTSEEPFFAYLAYTAPHWPLQAPSEDIAKYKGVYDAGWTTVQQARVSRMKADGLIPEGIQIPEIVTQFPDWNALSKTSKAIEVRRMEIFAAMVDRLDQQVGRLIAYLKATDQYDNTVIWFMSDNGNEGAPLQNLPIFANWIPRFDNSLENMGKPDSYVMIDERWAQVSNTPHRLYKGMPTDGGIHVPSFITYGGFENQAARYDGVVHVMDVTPTVLELAGLKTDFTQYAGSKVHPVQGKSLLVTLNDPAEPARTADDGLGWELFNKKAYRKGKWKIVQMHPPWGSDAWQLFDLSKDPGETQNVARQFPEIVKRLSKDWAAYAEANGVIIGNEPPER